MRNLYKKISAVLLSVMLISVGCLSSVNAFYLRGYGSVYSMRDFAKQEGFKIIKRAENEEDMKSMLDNMKLQPNVKQRLKDGAVKIRNVGDFMQLPKSGKQLHLIDLKGVYYLILFDQVSIQAAKSEPKHKFYDRLNQRNYNVVEFYSKQLGYDIQLVMDYSSSPLRAEMSARIRSMFGYNHNLMKKLLKEPERIFKDAESFISHLKSSNNVIKNGEHHRVRVGNLDFIILKK